MPPPQDRLNRTPSRLDSSVYRKALFESMNILYSRTSNTKHVPLSQRGIQVFTVNLMSFFLYKSLYNLNSF